MVNLKKRLNKFTNQKKHDFHKSLTEIKVPELPWSPSARAPAATYADAMRTYSDQVNQLVTALIGPAPDSGSCAP